MSQLNPVGLVWDAYTPAVEGQVTRDLIALQNVPGSEVIVICGDEADRVLKALRIKRGAAKALAGLWITYRTGQDQVFAPEHAETVIDRDLYVAVKETELDDSPHAGYYMKPQGRIVPPQLNLNRPPPSHTGPTDPIIQYLWG